MTTSLSSYVSRQFEVLQHQVAIQLGPFHPSPGSDPAHPSPPGLPPYSPERENTSVPPSPAPGDRPLNESLNPPNSIKQKRQKKKHHK